jgi:hypothetical protein
MGIACSLRSAGGAWVLRAIANNPGLREGQLTRTPLSSHSDAVNSCTRNFLHFAINLQQMTGLSSVSK